jgi:hypothetical protein
MYRVGATYNLAFFIHFYSFDFNENSFLSLVEKREDFRM